MIDVTLAKAKYHRPGKLRHAYPYEPPGLVTMVWQAGSFKAPSRGQAIRCRRKVYLGAVGGPSGR